MKRTLTFASGLLLSFLLFALFAPQKLTATPDLAARFAQDCFGACHDFLGNLPQWSPNTKCSLTCFGCHISPSGGGMRRDEGFAVAKKALHAEFDLGLLSDQDKEKVDELSPKVGEMFRVGGDLRVLYRDTEAETLPSQESIWLMESYLYVAAEPLSKLRFVYMHDFENEFGKYFAQLHSLPLNSVVQVGRFDVPYGLKVADHTSFIRSKLGFGNNAADDGVMVSFNPGRPYLNVAYTNGGIEAFPGTGDQGKATTVSGGYWHERFSIGGSYYRNRDDMNEVEYYGVQGSLTVWKASYLGEFDWIERIGDGVDPTKGIVAFHQLNFYPIQGLNFRLQYDFYDPDTDLKNGIEERYVAGVQFFPMPFLQLDGYYRWYREEDVEIDNDELVFVLHGFF